MFLSMQQPTEKLLTMMTDLTSLADDPETSIQVLEKNAQDVSMKVVYSMAWTGSSITW